MDGERLNFLRFLDLKGYLIMAFMMSFGFGLRLTGLIPNWFFAFFYTGLGCALALAGRASCCTVRLVKGGLSMLGGWGSRFDFSCAELSLG